MAVYHGQNIISFASTLPTCSIVTEGCRARSLSPNRVLATMIPEAADPFHGHASPGLLHLLVLEIYICWIC